MVVNLRPVKLVFNPARKQAVDFRNEKNQNLMIILNSWVSHLDRDLFYS
jgi:hypothetical protein